MSDVVVKHLNEFIMAGQNVLNETDIIRWHDQVFTYLKQLFGNEVSHEFLDLGRTTWDDHFKHIGFLQALCAKLAAGLPPSSLLSIVPTTSRDTANADCRTRDKKVFVVHGHDMTVKESSARFLEKLGLDAIILHEQANSGQTVIEKFEMFSDVGFAVILLTPDDLGHPVNDAAKIKPRARQNVILELGYFLGKLGRNRVAALCADGVEIPSDYQGVVYIELDKGGAWRTKLAQELIMAGMSINLSGLIQ